MNSALAANDPVTDTEAEVELLHIFEELEDLHQQMAADQAHIDRLKVETNALRQQSDRLRSEGLALDKANRASLDRLKTAVGLC